jgi:hypothetical protein
LIGVILSVAHLGFAADEESVQVDERILREAGISTDGTSLLEFFRKGTPANSSLDAIKALIKQMGDASFQVREKASSDLSALGIVAAPLLRQAQTDPDIEIARRAEHALQLIEETYRSAIPCAAARIVAYRKPEGAVEVLLGYLPFAGDETVVEEVRDALTALGFASGQSHPALLAALNDEMPVRRGVAGEVLVRGGAAGQRDAARKLLTDPDPAVRLRIALALTTHADREAVPSLISLLTEIPIDQAWRIENILYQLAGAKSPSLAVGNVDDSRRANRDAWSGWWRDHGMAADLTRLAPRHLGHTLLIELSQAGPSGQVREVGRDGKNLWKIDNLQQPLDAWMIDPDRVLVTEYGAKRVTERDLRGKILWQHAAPAGQLPLSAQRLPNGNTFIVLRQLLLEVTPDHKETVLYRRPVHEIAAASRTPDGSYLVVTMSGQLVRLNAEGAEVQTFSTGSSFTSLGVHFDPLSSRRVLMPQAALNRVVELDPNGRVIWESKMAAPTTALRLPNGNTLIGSMAAKQVQEVNRAGQQVNAFATEGSLMGVRQR